MKLQYLGDSKDSFKWDYLHFLAESLAYEKLVIVWMMTADDGSTYGRTAPETFPARKEILDLCHRLRTTRQPAWLLELPAIMGAGYTVGLHDAGKSVHGRGKHAFFREIEGGSRHVVFLDPDNGFEPERNATDSHVRYPDLDRLIRTLPDDAVVVVFQHHRRRKFVGDFARIRERLLSGFSTAIYWRSVMFVCIASSAETIAKIEGIHREYAKQRPVEVIGQVVARQLAPP